MDETSSDVNRSCHDAAPQELLRGVMQFNRGEYYPCHETLEDLWMAESGPIRCLYQGILQIAVALHHRRRGNYRGTVALLAGGSERLAALPAVCRQVDVRTLRADTAFLQQRIERLGPQGMARLEDDRILKIHLCTRPHGRG